ncbi:hypothetical protein H310_06648 [Aphanomyces invadans]|uniref:Uncharacterized protein n=1 Tax=Aphanomyces invadans TaxID=157072 RepID=A0A024U553_9STRA|nr:hypothetical protein H310_06648 [Aphanomyces invadans]ETW01012.1 hypothetical protein H310_06648 [Aphanomyces invadans]|eukprot:XP_008870010.1 hypothetical protein H310_06648 [Aphanomyces invadans]
MGVTSPKKTNRWTLYSSSTLLSNRESQQHSSPSAPPRATVSAACADVDLLQQRDLVLCQQRKLFVVLTDEIADLFKVCRIADCEGDFDELPVNTYVQRNQSIVLIESLRNYVKDFGSRARVHWEKLDNIEQSQVFRAIGLFAIGITDGIRQVEAERDPMNKPSIELAPLIMPHYLVKMRPATSISEPIRSTQPRRATAI